MDQKEIERLRKRVREQSDRLAKMQQDLADLKKTLDRAAKRSKKSN